jgi:hypothetical protein
MQSSERTVTGAGPQVFPALPNHFFPARPDAAPRGGTRCVEVV